jgi:hypothetical protein
MKKRKLGRLEVSAIGLERFRTPRLTAVRFCEPAYLG